MLEHLHIFNGAQFRALSFLFKIQGISHYSTFSIKAYPCFSNYLVESLGFSEQQSLSTLSKFAQYRQTNENQRVSDSSLPKKANSVVNFLKKHGFNQTQIRNFVIVDPRILTYNVDKTLKPKLKLLQDLGFTSSDISEAVLFNLNVLSYSKSSILPTIQVLRQVLCCDADVILVIKRSFMGFRDIAKHLIPNVELLVSYGIPIELIRKHIVRRSSAFLRPPECFRNTVFMVEQRLGVSRHSGMFLSGVLALAWYTEEDIDSKCEIFKSFEMTESDIKAMLSTYPGCLSYSESRVKKMLHCMIKELGYVPAYIATRPQLLTYSLEKRIVPRHKVLVVLKEKGFIRMDYPLYNAVCLSESFFLKQFVLPFKDVHELYTKEVGHALPLKTDRRRKPASTASNTSGAG